MDEIEKSGVRRESGNLLNVVLVDNPTLAHLPALSATVMREIGTQNGRGRWHQPLDQTELQAIGKA